MFFVSPEGKDTWSGTRASRNWMRNDGPFATPGKALDAARAFRRAQPSRQATILLRAGVYLLAEPLVLTAQDSGLQISAYPNERPVLSGGRQITGWKEERRNGQKRWIADLPQVRQGQWRFHQLWVNGRRAVRARHPDNGYLQVEALADATPDWNQGHTRFRFAPGNLRNWPGITNAEVIVMNRWVESRLPISAIEEKERLVSFGLKSVFRLDPGDPYYVEGALAHLNTVGEWCLDPTEGKLYYLPEGGEDLSRVSAFAPVLPKVLVFDGRAEPDQTIQNIKVSGLTFSHTEWYFSKTNFTPEVWPGPLEGLGGFGQAAVGVPGAVQARFLFRSRFEECRFVNLGGYGLELEQGCSSNIVSRCEMGDLGAGGVKIGEVYIRRKRVEIASANEISDCHIHDGGKVFHSAVGIWVGQSPGNRLLHNHLHDFYYSGISLGWSWGYGIALGVNTLVAFNEVHHIGQKSNSDGPILSDMAGIYTLGRQTGTRIVNNLWHDVTGLRYGGWGIYFDEGTSDILACSNVVYRTTHGGFHQHYGMSNRVFNNIFAYARDFQIQRTKAEPRFCFSFETNIVYFDTGKLLGGDWSGTNYCLNNNLYFDARPEKRPETWSVGPFSLAQWRAKGNDRRTMITDPRFDAADPLKFKLKPDSPVFRLGFQPIDLSTVGIRPKGTK